MSRVVFLLEEYSLRLLLESVLPRFFPSLRFQCIHHDGKQDLEKSLPRKLRAWREPGVRFCVIRDNDGAECVEVKRRLHDLCEESGRPETIVRIACQEIEAWYLGDLAALEHAYEVNSLQTLSGKARFRDPDSVVNPSGEIAKLIPEFQKVSGARRVAPYLSRQHNRSHSFHALMNRIENLLDELHLN